MKNSFAIAAFSGGAVLTLLFADIGHLKAQEADGDLKPASAFQAVDDETERSLALFAEAGKVILHPRCVNCHPATDSPLHTMNMHKHQPPVIRGLGGMGAPGMMCTTCHGAENVAVVGQSETLKSIPGNPNWHLAPVEMAWHGKTLGEICVQIKDPARNGDMTMEELTDHMAHDDLVGWAWDPGEGREPAPGSQEVFGDLIKAWVASGAACPD